jgi:hypothetical protein
MFDWFRRKKPVPQLGMQENPVQLNPSPSARDLRNRARITRLEEAIKSAKGERKTDLVAELKRRRGA